MTKKERKTKRPFLHFLLLLGLSNQLEVVKSSLLSSLKQKMAELNQSSERTSNDNIKLRFVLKGFRVAAKSKANLKVSCDIVLQKREDFIIHTPEKGTLPVNFLLKNERLLDL